MVKRIVVALFLFSVAGATVALAAKTRMEARVYFGDAQELTARMGSLLGRLDVATSGRTPGGEHYLVVLTDGEQLRQVQLMGFKTEVTYPDLRDKFRLMTGQRPGQLSGRDFGYYFTYWEMRDTIRKLAQNFPALVRIDSSMHTFANKPLYCMRIWDSAGTSKGKPQVFINGAIHAREPMGTHTCISFATLLCTRYGVDSITTWLLKNREIYIIPVMNPDGYVYNSDSGGADAYWRKNRHSVQAGDTGIDLNRNYGYKWGYDDNGSSPYPWDETYRGPSRVSEVETQQIRDFEAGHKFRTQMDFHTYGQYNLCSYGYQDRYPVDSMMFKEILDTIRGNNGYSASMTGPIARVLYYTNGGSTDWESGDTLQGSKFYTYALSTEEGINDFWYGWNDSNYVKSEVALNIPNCFYLTRIAGAYLDTVRNGRVINDSASGNRNGQLDPNENANIWFTIRNRGVHPLDTAESVSAVLRASDTMVHILTSSVTFPSVNPRRSTSNNGGSQFQVYASPNAVQGSTVTLRLEVAYTDDTVHVTQPLYYRITIGNHPIARHDVGCTKIVSPGSDVDSGFPLTPACSLYNYGSATETYRVRMQIDPWYNESVLVSSHSPGAGVYVTFPSVTPVSRGDYVAKCSTRLSGDVDPTNDGRRSAFTVYVRDVEVYSITEPRDTIDSGVVVTPAASVYNNGTAPAGFWTMMRIWDAIHPERPGYYDQESSYVLPGSIANVVFASWPAIQRGNLTVRCSTMLDRELHHENDARTRSIRVRVLDVAAVAILAPVDSVALGDTVTPTVVVANLGTDTASLSTAMRIGTSWREVANGTLSPGVQDTVEFLTPWVAEPLGTYFVGCSLHLTGDMVPGNDRMRDSVTVYYPSAVNDGEALTALPQRFALYGAWPNPARGPMQIRYELAAPANVRIAVYDIRGRLVRKLVDARQVPGRFGLVWSCGDDRERRVAPGVYFCRMTAGDFQGFAKLLIAE